MQNGAIDVAAAMQHVSGNQGRQYTIAAMWYRYMGDAKGLTVWIETFAAHLPRTEIKGTPWDDPYCAVRHMTIVGS